MFGDKINAHPMSKKSVPHKNSSLHRFFSHKKWQQKHNMKWNDRCIERYTDIDTDPVKDEDLNLKESHEGHRAVHHFPPEMSKIQSYVTGIN